MRTFVSIHPPAEAVDKLAEIQRELKDGLRNFDYRGFRNLKWEDPGKFHLTLFFIGETGPQLYDKVDSALESATESFKGKVMTIESGNIGSFPNMRFPRVIYIELLEKEGLLRSLAETVNLSLEGAGLKQDKPFKPHITLARVRRDSKINLSGFKYDMPGTVVFNSSCISLCKSILRPEGSEYSELRSYSFV